jgi:hypothetical protein
LRRRRYPRCHYAVVCDACALALRGVADEELTYLMGELARRGLTEDSLGARAAADEARMERRPTSGHSEASLHRGASAGASARTGRYFHEVDARPRDDHLLLLGVRGDGLGTATKDREALNGSEAERASGPLGYDDRIRDHPQGRSPDRQLRRCRVRSRVSSTRIGLCDVYPCRVSSIWISSKVVDLRVGFVLGSRRSVVPGYSGEVAA